MLEHTTDGGSQKQQRKPFKTGSITTLPVDETVDTGLIPGGPQAASTVATLIAFTLARRTSFIGAYSIARMSNRYLSIEDILAEEERVPCVFFSHAYRLGHLDPTAGSGVGLRPDSCLRCVVAITAP